MSESMKGVGSTGPLGENQFMSISTREEDSIPILGGKQSMNEVRPFSYGASPVRIVSGLEESEKGKQKVMTLGGEQSLIVVNESGMYTLVIRSNKPQEKPFRRWVTNEVLPSIRKTGAYSTVTTQYELPSTLSQALHLAAKQQGIIAETARLASLETELSNTPLDGASTVTLTCTETWTEAETRPSQHTH